MNAYFCVCVCVYNVYIIIYYAEEEQLSDIQINLNNISYYSKWYDFLSELLKLKISITTESIKELYIGPMEVLGYYFLILNNSKLFCYFLFVK